MRAYLTIQIFISVWRLFDIDGDGMISEEDLKSVIPDAPCHNSAQGCGEFSAGLGLGGLARITKIMDKSRL